MAAKLSRMFFIIGLIIILIFLYFLVINNTKEVDPPIITLNGSDVIKIYKYSTYVDPGFNAYDSVDGDLTDKVTIFGNVNTRRSGEYTLFYEVENSNHKRASVSRTVKVVKPNQDESINLYLLGSEYITLIKGDNYVDDGVFAYDEIDGNITNRVITRGKVDTSKIGKYILTYTVTNSRGATNEVKRYVEVKNNTLNEVIFNYSTEWKARAHALIKIKIDGYKFDHIVLPNGKVYKSNEFEYNVYEYGEYDFVIVTKDKKIIHKKINITSDEDISPIYANRLTISDSELDMIEGESYKLSFRTEPSRTDDIFIWSSSNMKVATVNNGLVEAVGKGNAVLSLKTSNGLKEVVLVRVKEKDYHPKVESIALDNNYLNLKLGDKYIFNVSLKPLVNEDNINWTSSNNNVAIIDDGKLTAIGKGSTTIKVEVDGLVDYCEVNVK